MSTSKFNSWYRNSCFFFATGFDKKPLDINVDIGKMKPCHNEKVNNEKVNNEKVNNVKVKTVKVKMSKPNIHFSGVKLSQTILRLFEVTCVVRLVHLEEFSSFVFLPNLSHARRKVVASCSVVFFPSSCWYCFNSKIGFRWNRFLLQSFERRLNDSSLQILVDIKTNDIALVGWNDMFAVSSFKLKKWKERKNAEATLQTLRYFFLRFLFFFSRYIIYICSPLFFF